MGSRTGRVVLVTGASSGLGAAVAQRLAAAGHQVHAAARWRTTPAEEAAPGVVPLRMDVTDDEQVRAGVARIVDSTGRLDVVVNAAGYGVAGALEDTSPAEAAAQLDVNLLGVHRVTRAVLPHLRASQGHLVVVSSIAGLIAVPFQGLYSASKYALEGYTEALRLEVAPFGVRVSLVEPGDFATGFTAARQVAADAGPGSAYRDRFVAALATMASDEEGGSDAGAVAAAVLRIVQSDRPRLRYTVGPGYQRVAAQLRRVLPAAVLARSVSGHYAGRPGR